MASIDKTNRTVLGGIGLVVVALLLWSYCGRVDDGAVKVARPTPEAPVPTPAVVEEPAELPAVAAAPVAAAPIVDESVAEESVGDTGEEALSEASPEAVAPVVPAASKPMVAEVAAAPAATVAAVKVAETPVESAVPELPPVSASAAREPVPEQDLLIAKSSAKRFTPDVAALATTGLSVGVPIQGDEGSLNVLQPCDTPASGCGAGADPGQVVGGANDWTGFVIPGF